jgi:hypothetical protein
MKTILLGSLIVCCMLQLRPANAQSLIIPPDSTYITFPNSVKIVVIKSGTGNNTVYQIERKAFKTLALVTNHYLNQHAVTGDNVDVLLRNQDLFDSTYILLQKKFEMERERTNLYKTAYDDLKVVSLEYEKELRTSISDLKELKKEKEFNKTKAFVKGILWGLAIGSVGGIVAGAAIN